MSTLATTLQEYLGVQNLLSQADVSTLLDITMTVSTLESSSFDFSDVCVGVVGRLFSHLCQSNWGSSVLKILVFKDYSDGSLCEECINIKQVQLMERFSDALALLRFLVVNLWQEEVAFCLRVAELNTLGLGILRNCTLADSLDLP
nr:hypothetical transcript [Hymenolepis microstoma]